MRTIAQVVASGPDDATAVAALDGAPLTYRALRQQIVRTVEQLNRLGIGRGDPVAIVLPNGPAMATAFVSIAAGAIAAPLNPAYRPEEFAFDLTDLSASALVTEAGTETPARAVAAERGIPVLELVAREGGPAGAFTIEAAAGAGRAAPAQGGIGDADDVGLVLHTSGTTSRPKIVPLRQRNLAASAGNIRDALALTAADRCLNVMPLFHIHGLVAAVLGSLAAGGSVVCTPGFNALSFFAWLDTCRPTWFTAVPAMSRALLARAARNEEILARARLRFIRSSSVALPPQVMAALERSFRCPVIESYGMTEASHQITSNPLPPAVRKPGSVGIAAGPEVAVMNEAGRLLPPGAIGEVVIRGANVMAGYRDNAGADAGAFSDGWFRTGDQGVLDEDGYLTITGRLKEIINRGGQKVAPLEVDNVLVEHPAVAQAATFAMPHPALGEEVAAAVVLVDRESASEADIRAFAAARLADFKVPRRIVFLDDIPTGATGKLQRIGLAAKLGLS